MLYWDWQINYSAHSPRAGFASDAFLAARDFVSIRGEGRWASDASLRIYLDVVSTAAQSAAADIQRWRATLTILERNFMGCFPRWHSNDVSVNDAPPSAVAAAVNAYIDARTRTRPRTVPAGRWYRGNGCA